MVVAMAMTCTVCRHPARAEIDKALIGGEPVRVVASRYVTQRGRSLGHMALYRHKDECLPATLAKAQDSAALASADALMAELRRCMARVNLLFDACDRWLRDPEQPDQYDIGPRAGDVKLVYTEPGPDGKPIRKRARLSELLAQVEAGAGITVERGEYKHADPRELVLKTAAQLQSHLELLAKLAGQLDERPQVTLTLSPDWPRLIAGLREVLAPHPAILEQVSAHLLSIEEGAARAR